jgi:hypothetical protein
VNRFPVSALVGAAVLSFAASASAQFVTPVPSVFPAWLVPYPGVSAQNRQAGNAVESTFNVAAPPHVVLAHFRALFASAGQPFQPDPMGGGFLIRAPAPECDLEIVIRRRDSDTAVKMACSPRLAATEQITAEHARIRAAQEQNDTMKKFDSPVYPRPKAPQPALAWPAWLVRVDGARLQAEKLPGQLKSSFTSAPTRDAIQAFYANLLAAHNYSVAQGVAPAADRFGSWVRGASPAGEPGRAAFISIKIKPAGPNFIVELTVQ